MDDEEIRYEVASRVAPLALSCPERLSAFIRRMRDELFEALARADTDTFNYAKQRTSEGCAAFTDKRAPRHPLWPSRDVPAFHPAAKSRPFA